MILKPRQFRKPNLSHPLARGLVGYWLMNEGAGNKVFDLSGNGNTGSLVADTHFVPGKFGLALDFDGKGDYVALSNTIPAQAGTIVAWIKVDKEDNCSVAGIGGVSYSEALLIYDSFDRFYIGDGDNTHVFWIYPDGTFNEWRQVVAVCDGINAYGYIDGVSLGAGQAFANFTGIERLAGGYAYDFGGQIDHAMIFSRALSASEITQLYREPFCTFDRDPIELWSAATLGAGAPPVGMAGAMTTNTGYWGW